MKERIILIPCWVDDLGDDGSIVPKSGHRVVRYGIGEQSLKEYTLPPCDWDEKESRLGAKYDSFIDQYYIN